MKPSLLLGVSRTMHGVYLVLAALAPMGAGAAAPARGDEQIAIQDARLGASATAVGGRLREYFERMSAPKPVQVRSGQDWADHRRDLQKYVLSCAGLDPLPQRVPLDVTLSEPLDHPWCTVWRVSYQLWPGVYATGLLFMPKIQVESPGPSVLCPHGHWQDGNAHPDVQKRCLNLARLGYVVFSTTQHHFEYLSVGVSHQTLMIWNNMRALDLLESLPEVDRSRLAVAGASGGGLQAQMLAALDSRVKAATIVGLTCDYRQIMFPDGSHCNCNHFPGIMRRTDLPEIAGLALPAALQFLTMNDWTASFEADNFPTLLALYQANGAAERIACHYFDTGHDYDQTKREFTYAWINHWLSDRPPGESHRDQEPDTVTLPVEAIHDLAVSQPRDRGFSEIARIFHRQRSIPKPDPTVEGSALAYRNRLKQALPELLGEDVRQPRGATVEQGEPRWEDDLIIETVAFPSEGPLVVPTHVLRQASPDSPRLPVVVMLSAEGKDTLLARTGPHSPRERARSGRLVVLPDVRTFGELFSAGTADAATQRRAWERNGIVWGRPVAGMAVTDLQAVLDGTLLRSDAAPQGVEIVAEHCGDQAVAGLFTMILDQRVQSADLDFAGAGFENGQLMLIPRILLFGDVADWVSVIQDRKVQVRHLPGQ